VLDGEIVCLDDTGRPQFKALLFRRGDPVFVAFDLLYQTSKDLRFEQLLDRKAALRRVLNHVRRTDPLMYADHVEEKVEELFLRACEIWRESSPSSKPALILANAKLAPGGKF
jgi:ATP-dependent DNA ligase